MRELKQSQAANVIIFMADSTDHITGKTGLTLTVTLSKDGGAFASITPTVTERTSGWYNIALTTLHTDTVGDLVVRATATGADASERPLNVVANVEADTYALANGANGFANIKADTANIQTRLPSALVSGRMDASVGSNLDKTGYSLTQSFPANFADLAITVTTGRVTVGTNADKTGYSISGAKTTLDMLNDITAAAVWAAATRTLSSGANISLAKGTGVTGFNDIAASDVWTSATRALTDKAGFELSAAGVDAVLDEVVEGTLTLRQIMRINLAALAGKSAGGGTATLLFKGADGTTTRITATVDANGNRTAMTVNGA